MDIIDGITEYLFAGIIILIGLILFIHFQYEKRRTRLLKEAALGMGFLFEEKFEPGDELIRLQLFTQGHARKATNLISGYFLGLNFRLFDFRYTIGGGNSSRIIRQTVAHVELKSRHLPEFYLGPANFFHRMGKKMGYKKIDFEYFPDFSKKYVLKGEDEAQIQQAFKPYILDYLQNKTTGFSIEGLGKHIIYYRKNKRIKPVEIRQFMEMVREIVDLFNH